MKGEGLVSEGGSLLWAPAAQGGEKGLVWDLCLLLTGGVQSHHLPSSTV